MATFFDPATRPTTQPGTHTRIQPDHSSASQANRSDYGSNIRPAESATRMQVRKRNGDLKPVDINKIIHAVQSSCQGLPNVDPIRVASKTIGSIFDGISTRELDSISIQIAATLIAEEPEYSRLAARLLLATIDQEVACQKIYSFSQSIDIGHREGILSAQTADFVLDNARKLNSAIDDRFSDRFEYFGLRIVYDRFLLRHPITRQVTETPQYFFMRVAVGLSADAGAGPRGTVPDPGTSVDPASARVNATISFYNLLASHDYLPESATLLNSGTENNQLCSSFLRDSPLDSLEAIYDAYKQIALISKYSGSTSIAFHRIRSEGSLIRATNNLSNGIIPWLRTLDASVGAVSQGCMADSATCVYLESWHADIESFLDLANPDSSDPAPRTSNLNFAHWIPDLFMRRVDEDGIWSLFDPKDVPQLTDLYGDAFEHAYIEAEQQVLYKFQLKARDLYARMMQALAETATDQRTTGSIAFKDTCNLKCNQTGEKANVVHLAGSSTEITAVSSHEETAACSLGSINLARHLKPETRSFGKTVLSAFDFEKLAATVRQAILMLDRVNDINDYPIPQADTSSSRWRPIGLGIMGLQDVFFALRLPFDSPDARELSTRIQEEIYYHALSISCELAELHGSHPAFKETRAAQGEFQFDLWGVTPKDEFRWESLRRRMKLHGLRNSLLIAIAPTGTIASIAGCHPCIEPQVSNLTTNILERHTPASEFLQFNPYLVAELKTLGLWSEAMRTQIKLAEGSIQKIAEIPNNLKRIYRTAWEMPMRSLIDMAADRGAFIDQSQSLNLYVESPNSHKLSSMYKYAWTRGLKSAHTLRVDRARSADGGGGCARTTAACVPGVYSNVR